MRPHRAPATTPRRTRAPTLLALLTPLVAACGEGTTAPAADTPADPSRIAAMQIRFARSLSTEQTVTIRSPGFAGGPLIVGKPDDRFGWDDAVRVETLFLDAQGAVVAPLAGVDLLVTSADTTLLRYSGQPVGPLGPKPVGAFDGVLLLMAKGDTRLTLHLVRAADRGSLLGPFTLPVSVEVHD